MVTRLIILRDLAVVSIVGVTTKRDCTPDCTDYQKRGVMSEVD